MAKTKNNVVPWSQTPAGHTAYLAARADAQAAANKDGFDRRIEANDVFREGMVGMLPRREHRFGFEARCEVVSCEDLSRCQPGHGP